MVPREFPLALEHKDLASRFLKVRLTSSSVIPLHGLDVLQSNVTATSVVDVPVTLLYKTSLI